MLIRSVLFNFQGAFLNSAAVISFRRLCYYITSFRFCQEVFLTFFQSFFRTFLISFQEVTFFSKAFILYHIVSCLSRGF